MKAVNIVDTNLNSWTDFYCLADVLRYSFMIAKDYRVEELIDKIKGGKTVIITITSKTVKKSDIEFYLNKGFEVFAVNAKDFDALKDYWIG